MEMKLISMAPSGVCDKIVKVKITPCWFARAFLGEKEREAEFVGFGRAWRQLPGLWKIDILSSTASHLNDVVAQEELRIRLRAEGRLKD